ncbi:MAG TPA: type II toxin-antitoxin system VapC family toxin [Gemmatimonadaceae bacterium]|jgi:PIN domain nuclease of toxin-antitoxin system
MTPKRAPGKRRPATAVAESRVEYAARRILLDTHTWLWWYDADRRLGARARALIAGADEVRFSAVSAWEIVIKQAIGKLVIRGVFDLARELDRDGFLTVPITIAHTEEVRHLPSVHRDPFDRLLVAQARVEGLTILTGDDAISRYDVPVIDARG